jgi:uncharacterized membrane protein
MPDSPAGPPAASDTGLAPNVAGALAYLLMPFTGIAFLLLEKRDGFVRFHAAQSILAGAAVLILWVVFTVLAAIVSVVPILGPIVAALAGFVVWLAAVALWLLLMFQAFSGNEWEIPGLGEHARRMVATTAAHS